MYNSNDPVESTDYNDLHHETQGFPYPVSIEIINEGGEEIINEGGEEIINEGGEEIINECGEEIINEGGGETIGKMMHRTISYQEAIAQNNDTINETTFTNEVPTSIRNGETVCAPLLSSTHVPPLTRPLPNKQLIIPHHFNKLNIPEEKELQKKYEGYWMYLIALLFFYSIPVYQLVLTYQKVLITY